MDKPPTLEELKARLAAIPDDEPGTFKPLDQFVADDLAILGSVEMKGLLSRCRGGLPVHGLGAASMEWGQSLTPERMGQYCASVSGLMESALLHCGRPLEEAVGQLHDGSNPHFTVVPTVDSLLFQEADLKHRRDHSVTYGVAEFATHIARRCEDTRQHGEYAWRAIAACMREGHCDGLLPRIEVQRHSPELEIRIKPMRLSPDLEVRVVQKR